MPLDPVRVAAEMVEGEVLTSFSSLMVQSDVVRNHVAERIRQWERTAKRVFVLEFPLLSHDEKLAGWEERLPSVTQAEGGIDDALSDYMSFCKAAGLPANEPFWRKEFRKHAQKDAEDRSVTTALLLSNWRKRLDQARVEWELKTLQALRAELAKELDEFLRLLRELQETLEGLGLDVGILFDLSKGTLTTQDMESFKRWAKYLTQDEGVRALCEMLGRLRDIELSEKIERVQTTSLTTVRVPDINSREEIVGIRLGRDIEHVLPAELALLADPDTATLFDLKYVESRLMCFDMQGIQDVHRHIETEQERSVKEAQKLGPMIICIDTSGSMSGAPETIAKAIALFMATKAREQKRACYLINFSTGISTLELTAGLGMEALMRFLQMSFHGGTDVAPALRHALDMMERDAYGNADLLVVSDFIMADLPGTVLSRIEDRRAYGSRFHSLVVGSCYMTQQLRTLFDNEWIYDPQHSRIQELVGFERRMTEAR